MFKSAERAARRQQREQEQARAQGAARQAEEERRQAEWAASPVGAATIAKNDGQEFLQVQLKIGQRAAVPATVLGEVEALGWRLENVGYYFRSTGFSIKGRVGQSWGSNTNLSTDKVTGTAVGVYLFRNVDKLVRD